MPARRTFRFIDHNGHRVLRNRIATELRIDGHTHSPGTVDTVPAAS